ncbi:DUF3572 family protein [Altericroceibacterium xinjiangense]|uniref:DUF3572 family protein n=1 Tax=Altericroceibacterium xinjiangense TaxID=762261 RepID=UPI0019D28FF0|nr:DUF3572 family protein [Altericroceibacterium xinjiangense]
MVPILDRPQHVPADPGDLSLKALAWILSDSSRAHRLLDLTGLTPEVLRTGLARPEVQGAILDFLCAHEPDLIAAADEMGMDPADLAAARGRLGA